MPRPRSESGPCSWRTLDWAIGNGRSETFSTVANLGTQQRTRHRFTSRVAHRSFPVTARTTANRAPPRSSVAWLLVGAAYALGLLSVMTIGLFVLCGAVIASAALLATRVGRSGVLAIVCGPAAPLLYVAVLNRSGPGEVCTTVEDGVECSEMWSPWPWVAAAHAFLIAGSVLVWRQQHRGPTSSV